MVLETAKKTTARRRKKPAIVSRDASILKRDLDSRDVPVHPEFDIVPVCRESRHRIVGQRLFEHVPVSDAGDVLVPESEDAVNALWDLSEHKRRSTRFFLLRAQLNNL